MTAFVKALLLGRSVVGLLLGWLCPPALRVPEDDVGCTDLYALIQQHSREQETILRADGLDPRIVMRCCGVVGVLFVVAGGICQRPWMFNLGLILAVPLSAILYGFCSVAPALSHCFYRSAAMSKVGKLDANFVVRLAMFRPSTLRLALATLKARIRVLATRQSAVYGFTAKFPIVLSGLLIVACSVLALGPWLALSQLTMPSSWMTMVKNPPAPLQVASVALALSLVLAALIPAQAIRARALERAQLYVDLLEAALTYLSAASSELMRDVSVAPTDNFRQADNGNGAETSYPIRG